MPFSSAARENDRRLTTSQNTFNVLSCMAGGKQGPLN
jgi:hypothetical protein